MQTNGLMDIQSHRCVRMERLLARHRCLRFAVQTRWRLMKQWRVQLAFGISASQSNFDTRIQTLWNDRPPQGKNIYIYNRSSSYWTYCTSNCKDSLILVQWTEHIKVDVDFMYIFKNIHVYIYLNGIYIYICTNAWTSRNKCTCFSLYI